MIRRRKKLPVSRLSTTTITPSITTPITRIEPKPTNVCPNCPQSILVYNGEMYVCENCAVVTGVFLSDVHVDKEQIKDKDTGRSEAEEKCIKSTAHTRETARTHFKITTQAARIDPMIKIQADIDVAKKLILNWCARANLSFDASQFQTLSELFFTEAETRVNQIETRTAVLWYESTLLRGDTALTEAQVIAASGVSSFDFYTVLSKVAKVLHPSLKTNTSSKSFTDRIKIFGQTVENLVHVYRGPTYLAMGSKCEARVTTQLSLFHQELAKTGIWTRTPKTVACALLYLATKGMTFTGIYQKKEVRITARIIGLVTDCAPSAIRTCAKILTQVPLFKCLI